MIHEIKPNQKYTEDLKLIQDEVLNHDSKKNSPKKNISSYMIDVFVIMSYWNLFQDKEQNEPGLQQLSQAQRLKFCMMFRLVCTHHVQRR